MVALFQDSGISQVSANGGGAGAAEAKTADSTDGEARNGLGTLALDLEEMSLQGEWGCWVVDTSINFIEFFKNFIED